MRKIKRVVGISSGREKLDAIYGAINGKLINVLVTNAETAKLLLDK